MSRLRKIFVEISDVSEDSVILSASNRKYVYDVLRLKPGDNLIASDGSRSFLVELVTGKFEEESWAKIVEPVESGTKALIDITLAFGCIRPDPMEQIFRHCTELGVAKFAPILFERGNRRPIEKKLRWNNVVRAACAQSGRLTPPEIHDPVDLRRFLNGVSRENCARIMLSASMSSMSLLKALREFDATGLTLLVGPEGGLTTNEMKLVKGHGFVESSLAPSVLRTETAAIVGVGVSMTWAMEREILKHSQQDSCWAWSIR